jgi:hypothetical protein
MVIFSVIMVARNNKEVIPSTDLETCVLATVGSHLHHH